MVSRRIPIDVLERRMLQMGPGRSRVLYWAAFFLALLAMGCGKDAPPPAAASTRQIKVTTKKWNIEPAEIRVKRNEAVELQVSTMDVAHGFEVPELKIDEPVNPGPAVKIRIQVEKPGRYVVRCSILCGMGHEEMMGAIVVE